MVWNAQNCLSLVLQVPDHAIIQFNTEGRMSKALSFKIQTDPHHDVTRRLFQRLGTQWLPTVTTYYQFRSATEYSQKHSDILKNHNMNCDHPSCTIAVHHD